MTGPVRRRTAELTAAAGTLAYSAVLNRLLPGEAHIPGNLAAAGILTWYAHHTLQGRHHPGHPMHGTRQLPSGRPQDVAQADPAGQEDPSLPRHRDRWGRRPRRRHHEAWRELGLDHRDMGRGVLWGLALAVPVGLALGAAAILPATRGLFPATNSSSTYEAVVRVPLSTAIPEEVIFRGALLGLFLDDHPTYVAVIASSLLFGIWHVLPTLATFSGNPAHLVGGEFLTILVNVAFTALAGVFFAWLRLRSGSVVAPTIVHVTTNSVGLLAAGLAGR